MVINSFVTGTDGSGTTFHADVYQFYQIPSITIEDVILYGVTASIGGQSSGQGFFAGNNVSIKDVAFVNCNINNQLQPNDASVFQFGGPTTNMYVLNSAFTGKAYWRTDFNFTAKDVVLDHTTFSYKLSIVSGVTSR
jgi:hypothetical protein